MMVLGPVSNADYYNMTDSGLTIAREVCPPVLHPSLQTSSRIISESSWIVFVRFNYGPCPSHHSMLP
jgi:hypothetical protein